MAKLFSDSVDPDQRPHSDLGLHRLPTESAHDKTYNKTCAASEDSNQPAHPRSLVSFANRMCLLQPPGYPKRDN